MTGDRRLKLRKTFFITKTTLLNDCIHYIFSSYDLKVFCSLIIKSSFIHSTVLHRKCSSKTAFEIAWESFLGELKGKRVSWKNNERDWHGRVDWESSRVAKLVVKSL